jgi:hypothetical protein
MRTVKRRYFQEEGGEKGGEKKDAGGDVMRDRGWAVPERGKITQELLARFQCRSIETWEGESLATGLAWPGLGLLNLASSSGDCGIITGGGVPPLAQVPTMAIGTSRCCSTSCLSSRGPVVGGRFDTEQ